MGRGIAADAKLGDALVQCHRDLFAIEARLANTLAPRGARVRHSVVDQWHVLEEYLRIYASSLAPAGLLILGGTPDEGSCRTGIPFTGPSEARAFLGLTTDGIGASPSGAAFWGAVLRAQAELEDAPLESLFGSTLLAHAIPFDTTSSERAPLYQAGSEHVRRLLRVTRPQIVLAVGPDALTALGHAADEEALLDLARADEKVWVDHWPPGSRTSAYPFADVGSSRVRVIPCPSLVGERAEEADAVLSAALRYVW